MKNIIPAVITAILLLVFSIVCGFFLLVALNGFSESQGMAGLIFYVIWAILMSILFSAACRFMIRFVSSRTEKVKSWVIATVAVFACATLGSIAVIPGLFIAVIIVEAMN